MANEKKPELIELTWKESLSYISKVNPTLAEEIKKLNPGDEYTMIKVSYPWGCHLLEEGTLYIPNDENKLVTLEHESISSELNKKLDYNKTIPMGIVLNHSIELYINVNQRTAPFVYMPPGRIFALWISLQENKISNHKGRVSYIMAGTRSIMMLPKISDIFCYKKLKRKFNLQAAMPTGLVDQWDMFVELANHPEFPDPWMVEVLYFTDKWAEKIIQRKDNKWRLFREYLLNVVWEKTDYLRNHMGFEVAFSCALAEKNLKPNPYLADTVKHLYAIGQGIYPGFKIATDDEAAPISSFQKIFMDIYGLKYAPIIVYPDYLSDKSLQPIYYSLEVPTLMAFSPKSRKANNKLDDLREIKHVIEGTLKYFLEDKLKLKDSPLYNMANNIIFNYYHTDSDQCGNIRLTRELIEHDESLKNLLQSYKDKPFCETSTFLRGCISVAKK